MSVFAPDLLKGKAALVSGGTSGIGLGIARAYAAHGARVAVLGRDQAKADVAAAIINAEGGQAIALAADVRVYPEMEAAIEHAREGFGPLDIVVAAAAGNFLAEAAKMSANAFRTVVDIDLMGAFNCFRASYGALNRPGASLIAILAGQATRPIAGQAHACAAKAGVAMLVKCLALEWGPEGIRVNGLTPGPVADTEGMRRLADPAHLASMAASLPLQRLQRVEEVASAALFLASPAASYVTGAALDCDGGSQLGALALRG